MSSPSPFYRITALWAFSEAFLGGILHGFHIPVTGLVLGSFAVFCLSALATQTDGKWRFLKATLLVILVKAILSPQSPPQAYLAVFVQGFFAQILFSLPLPFRIQTLLLGIFALVESAFQRLIVLTVLFGADLWTAFDGFSENVFKSLGINSFSGSSYFIGGYVLVHSIVGVWVGFWAGQLPVWLQFPKPEWMRMEKQVPEDLPEQKVKTRIAFSGFISILILGLLLVALYEAYSAQTPLLVIKNKPLKLLIRSALILSVWYFYVAPILMKLFQKWVESQKSQRAREIEVVLKLLPEMQAIFKFSWKLSAQRHGIGRIFSFLQIVFFVCLVDEDINF